jgi:hypothetical protein
MFNFKLRLFNVCDYGVSTLIGHVTVFIFVLCLEASNYISGLLIVLCIVLGTDLSVVHGRLRTCDVGLEDE